MNAKIEVEAQNMTFAGHEMGIKAENVDQNDMINYSNFEKTDQQINSNNDDYSQQSLLSGVTSVTGVTPNRIKASSRNTCEKVGVTGVTEFPSMADMPCFRVFFDQIIVDGSTYRDGVWRFTIKDGEVVPLRLSSPVEVISSVAAENNTDNFGLLLKYKNMHNIIEYWSMPLTFLAGKCDDLQRLFLERGVLIERRATNRDAFFDYIQNSKPARQMTCATQVGWFNGRYILPNQVIGEDCEDIIFQSAGKEQAKVSMLGTLEGWQKDVAALAVDNPYFIFALSAAFTGPLLLRCQETSGGFHFFGDSSSGKSTLLIAACSVFGDENFKKSWLATGNGMEGTASISNDGLLALDEISECDPREVAAIVYKIANQTGKVRANKSGDARPVKVWRCVFLSAGEKTIKTVINSTGKTANAGVLVRALDMPILSKYGAWDNLHGYSSGASFSDAIKHACKTNHGHAIVAFLERLTKDKQDHLELFKTILERFSAAGCEGQYMRAVRRFACVAFAGELATKYGVTGWAEGCATEAVFSCFNKWKECRGRENSEKQQIIDELRKCIDTFGDSHFSNLHGAGESRLTKRFGYFEEISQEKGPSVVKAKVSYLFTSSAMREVLKNFDFNSALKILKEAGILKTDSSGKNSVTMRIPDGVIKRLCVINIHALNAQNDEF